MQAQSVTGSCCAGLIDQAQVNIFKPLHVIEQPVTVMFK